MRAEQRRADESEPDDVLQKRRKVVDAIHAMHMDQLVWVNPAFAQALEHAWDEYDTALTARQTAQLAAQREVITAAKGIYALLEGYRWSTSGMSGQEMLQAMEQFRTRLDAATSVAIA